jgi:hypothetical protein
MDCLSRIDRLVQAFAERAKMTDMIKVVVGHKHSRKRVISHIVLLKDLLQSSQADSGIDDYSAIFRSQIIAVTATSA